MPGFLWILLGPICVTTLFAIGFATLRKESQVAVLDPDLLPVLRIRSSRASCWRA